MRQEINAKAKIHGVDPPLYQSARTQGVSLTLPLVINALYPPRKEGVLFFTGTEDLWGDRLLRRLQQTDKSYRNGAFLRLTLLFSLIFHHQRHKPRALPMDASPNRQDVRQELEDHGQRR